MGYERIKTEHVGAKNRGGAWMTRFEAKQAAKRKRRQVDDLESGGGRQSPTSDYNLRMGTTRPKSTNAPKVAPPPPERRDLARGLPGTERERAEQRRRFAEEHRETLRRLGK
jgi:hypothetical protein